MVLSSNQSQRVFGVVQGESEYLLQLALPPLALADQLSRASDKLEEKVRGKTEEEMGREVTEEEALASGKMSQMSEMSRMSSRGPLAVEGVSVAVKEVLVDTQTSPRGSGQINLEAVTLSVDVFDASLGRLEASMRSNFHLKVAPPPAAGESTRHSAREGGGEEGGGGGGSGGGGGGGRHVTWQQQLAQLKRGHIAEVVNNFTQLVNYLILTLLNYLAARSNPPPPAQYSLGPCRDTPSHSPPHIPHLAAHSCSGVGQRCPLVRVGIAALVRRAAAASSRHVR